MAKANEWTRDQLLMALRLYMRTSFGRLHGKNPEIIALASTIGRTPGALAMKASNFASIDPKLKQKGLANASLADHAIWNEFAGNPTKLALETEEVALRLGVPVEIENAQVRIPKGATEKESLVKVRLVQGFFRAAVLISYEGRCAISGISSPELLVASHIMPWSVSVEHRANPQNGLILNALFDSAFDRGLLTFDDDHRVVLSKRLRDDAEAAKLSCSLLQAEGKKLIVPKRFPPLAESLEYHRTSVFRA